MKHRDVPLQLDAVAQQLKTDVSHLPDFILLQEVVFERPKQKGQENTAALLADLLGYQCNGTARDGGAEGVAILSRHPFTNYACRHLQARDGFLSGGFPRVSVMGDFQLPDLGLVRVVNLHLAQRPSQHDVRRDQLRETLRWMADRQREAPADLVIFGGDFNIEPDWEELALMRDLAATGNIEFKDYNSRLPTSGTMGNPEHRVDFVFVAAPHRTIESVGEAALWKDGIPTSDGTGRFWASDHLPLLHVFKLGPMLHTGN